jgi:hypothetical protein
LTFIRVTCIEGELYMMRWEVNCKGTFFHLHWKLPHIHSSRNNPLSCRPFKGALPILVIWNHFNPFLIKNKGLLEFSDPKALISVSYIVKMPLTNIYSTWPNCTIKMYTKTIHMCILLLHPLWIVKEKGPNLQIHDRCRKYIDEIGRCDLIQAIIGIILHK